MWKTVNLGEACLVRRGTTITKKHAVEGDVPVIGGGTKPTYFHNEPNRAASCITVSGSGASAGFVNRWNMPIFASDCSTVEPKDETQLPQFVYYYLLSQQQFIYDNFRSGAAQPHVYAKDIETLDFPVLPLAEQERIVAKLDTAFAEIDEAVKSTKQSKRLSSELIKAAILNKFESLPAECNIKFESACSFVRGPFGGSLKKSIFVESGYAVYEQQHPINNQFENFRYFITEEKFSEMVRFEVKPNDVLMSCSGVTLGRVGIVPKEAPKGIINQALLKITPKESLSSKYLQLLMRSDIFQNLIWGVSGGAAQPNVPPIKVIKNLILPIPSLQVQNELVNWANALQSLDVKNNLERKVQELSKLKSAILSQELKSSEAA
jgi:restriction endonuclease S subunit